MNHCDIRNNTTTKIRPTYFRWQNCCKI